MARRLIKRIELPAPSSGQTLLLACPQSGGLGAVNIVGGPNNSGKSFLLQRIWKLLTSPDGGGHFPGADINLELTQGRRNPEVLFLSNSWTEKNRIGAVDVGREPRQLPADQPPYSLIRLSLFHPHIMHHTPRQERIAKQLWLRDPQTRLRSLQHLEVERVIYECDARVPLVAAANDALAGRLYFRRAKADGLLEMVLLCGSGLTVPFPMWSDGQKALFYLFAAVAESEPDILLIDEPENHLHPSFITVALAHIKRAVPQTLLATHHPHLIFTALADRVFYLETEQPSSVGGQVPAATLPYTKVDRQGAPKRHVLNLSTELEKFAAAYRLFASQDAHLLGQARQVRQVAEVEFYGALVDALAPQVIAAGQGATPDRQTLQLADLIKANRRSQAGDTPLRILDFGAGVGRVVHELAKVPRARLGATVKWTCWEPNPNNRAELKRGMVRAGLSCAIPSSISQIPHNAFDIVLLANVLHELTPTAFADVVALARKALRGQSSAVLVLEIYPLLAPEKLAVSYPPDTLRQVLEAAGFVSGVRSFAVRGAEAYALVARQSGGTPPYDIAAAVEDAWRVIEKAASERYVARKSITDLREYQLMLHDLMVLSSIAACRTRVWSAAPLG